MSPNKDPSEFLNRIETADQLPKQAPAGDIVMMDWAVWRDLPSHPRQRDTERHAKAKHFIEAKASNKRIVKEHLAHVTAAIYRGRWYKVDGHTRTFLWENGSLKLPDDHTLRVTVFECRTRDELNKLYTMFDNPSAAERSYEQVYGAMRELNMELRSKRLRRGHFKDALFLAIRALPSARQPNVGDLDLYKATAVYKKELMKLDTMSKRGLVPSTFLTGVLAAALVSVKLWPKTIELWRALNEDEWERRGGRSDAAGILAQHINMARGNENLTRSSQWQEHLFRMALMAAKKWNEANEKGETHWFKAVPRELDPVPLIEAVRKKERLGFDLTLFIDPKLIEEKGPPKGSGKAIAA